MNRLKPSCMVVVIALFTLQSCTSGEEERLQQEVADQAAEQARQDSLEMVRQAEMEEIRQDSLDVAAMEAEAEAVQEPELPPLEFDAEGRFTVQIQSWRSREKAMNRAELLRSVGFEDAYVAAVGDSSTGDIWYRVKAGNVESLEMARRVQERLRSEFEMESWVDMAGE